MPPRSGRGAPAPVAEEVEARAARLGITPERVLREYARIGFSKITDVVEWSAEGILTAKVDPGDEVVAAIAEIVASASTQKIYRVKMHDKKPVLDVLARHLGMLAQPDADAADDEPTEDDADSARERLILALDRLAAEAAEATGDPEPQR